MLEFSHSNAHGFTVVINPTFPPLAKSPISPSHQIDESMPQIDSTLKPSVLRHSLKSLDCLSLSTLHTILKARESVSRESLSYSRCHSRTGQLRRLLCHGRQRLRSPCGIQDSHATGWHAWQAFGVLSVV